MGSGAKPTGGFDPLGQDLELFEVEVMSFREATAQAAQRVTPTPAEGEREPIGTTGIAEAPAEGEAQLPRTASPLPLTGLLGLLSLAGALGFRTLRRR